MSGQASAPASSGNLGPGFDCVALALELRCRVTAEPSDEWILEQNGAVSPGTENDLIVRAVRMAVDRPMRLAIENDIPRSRGLGSSSAVSTAAAVASIRVLNRPVDAEELFRIICELEGHADNAAAAVYGGLVLTESSGTWRHIELSPELRIVAAITDYPLSTDTARASLPLSVSLQAAARNLARVGFLIEGMRTADPEALAAAAGDEMHELPRDELSPLTGELMAAAWEAGALHVCWSGAGPSALAFCLGDRIDAVSAAFGARLGGAGTVMELKAASEGFR